MLGKKLFEWGAQDIIKGMSSSDNISDGGFSNLTDQVNITKEPGVVYAPPAAVDHSTNLSGQMIASCEDPTGNYARLFVAQDASSQDGSFYSMSTSYDLTVRGSTDSTHNYAQSKTDMIAFDGEAYITTDSTIVRWSSIGASNTFNTAFFTFNNAIAPHPALNYNNFAYYGDGNLLKRQPSAGSAPVTILTLPTGWVIVALGIDPGSGSMLISVIGQVNGSDTINSGAKVIFYNGASSTYQRIVQVDDMVTAFAATEGALYASYGQNLGLWNGSGITFLRKLNVNFDNEQLLYKQHFSSIGSTLLYIEKTRIMAYGPVRQKGDNVFYPQWNNSPGGTPANLTHIAYVGSNVMSMSYASSKFVTIDISSIASTGSMTLYSNSYDFDNEYWIRWIRVIYREQVPNNVDPGSLNLYNEDGFISNLYMNGSIPLQNTSGAASAFKDILNINARVKMIQFRAVMGTLNFGIRRIIFYGELADRP